MKKSVLVTLADRNYIDQAKQLFSSVYWNSGWKGDYMLISHKIPEKELKWFRKKGILVKKCRPIKIKKGNIKERPNFSKLYIFTPEFKKWKNIIFLDADIIVTASIDRLAEVKGIAGFQTMVRLRRIFPLLIGKRKKSAFKTIKSKYILSQYSFNTGVIAFSSDIIEEGLFEKAKKLAKYCHPHQKRWFDEPIINFIFQGKWKKLPIPYNLFWIVYAKNPKKFHAPIIHLNGWQFSWQNDPIYKEWKKNLEKAEMIDLSKRVPAKKVFSNEEIRALSREMSKEFKSIGKKAPVLRLIGKLGIAINSISPKLYKALKKHKPSFL